MGREFWTAERVGLIRSSYRERGPAVIAKELGTTAFAVVAKARRLGLEATRKKPPAGFKWTEEMLTAIQTRYEPEGPDALASEFGLSLHAVRLKANRMGLRTNVGHIRAGVAKADKNDSCNVSYFKTWSKDMAYVLGFLFADGCVNRAMTAVTICLASRDEAVLRFIKEQLSARYEIVRKDGRIDPRTGRMNRPQSCLNLTSKRLCESLVGLGMKPRKTYNDDPFPDVPDVFAGDFVRGYLDGDGCVHVRGDYCAVSFVGSPKFMEGFRDAISRLAKVKYKRCHVVTKKTTYSQLCWSANDDLACIRDFIYPTGHGFCLERKKDKLIGWFKDGVRGNRTWSEFETECVIRFYATMPVEQLAGLLGKSTEAVIARARAVGLHQSKEQLP